MQTLDENQIDAVSGGMARRDSSFAHDAPWSRRADHWNRLDPAATPDAQPPASAPQHVALPMGRFPVLPTPFANLI